MTTIKEILDINADFLNVALQRIEENMTIPRICRLIYLVYPEFFAKGVCIKNEYIIANECSEVGTVGNHVSQQYSQLIMVRFIKKVFLLYSCPLDPQVIGLLLSELEGDFSAEYLNNFPYIVRIPFQRVFKRNVIGEIEFVTYRVEKQEEVEVKEDTVDSLHGEAEVYFKEEETDKGMSSESTSLKCKFEDLEPIPKEVTLIVSGYITANFRIPYYPRICNRMGESAGQIRVMGRPLELGNGWYRYYVAFWIREYYRLSRLSVVI